MKFGNVELAPEEEKIINEIGWEKFERSVDANTTYCRLMSSYAKNLQGTEHDYPQYYGGAYVDEDGFLVIAVTEDVAECKKDLMFRIDDSMVRYQLVSFNYSFLQSIKNLIQNYIDSNRDDEVSRNIKAWGIRQKMNKVIVYLEDTNDERIKGFKEKITSSDAVQFMPMAGHFVADTVSIDAGNPIKNASVAYRALTVGSQIKGVVTAAHVVRLNNYIQTVGGTDFAKCIKRHYGVSADAAFCEITDANFVPSRDIYGLSGAILNNNTMDPIEGSIVYKVGSKTGLTSGLIMDTDFACQYKDGTRFQHLTATSYGHDHGDSGGIVYYLTGSTRFIAGVHCAGFENGVPENPEITAVYSKASKINSLLDIYGY